MTRSIFGGPVESSRGFVLHTPDVYARRSQPWGDRFRRTQHIFGYSGPDRARAGTCRSAAGLGLCRFGGAGPVGKRIARWRLADMPAPMRGCFMASPLIGCGMPRWTVSGWIPRLLSTTPGPGINSPRLCPSFVQSQIEQLHAIMSLPEIVSLILAYWPEIFFLVLLVLLGAALLARRGRTQTHARGPIHFLSTGPMLCIGATIPPISEPVREVIASLKAQGYTPRCRVRCQCGLQAGRALSQPLQAGETSWLAARTGHGCAQGRTRLPDDPARGARLWRARGVARPLPRLGRRVSRIAGPPRFSVCAAAMDGGQAVAGNLPAVQRAA